MSVDYIVNIESIVFKQLTFLPGSLSPKHPIFSPVVKGLINSSFCFSLPNLLMGPRYKELFTLIITPADAQPLKQNHMYCNNNEKSDVLSFFFFFIAL